MTLFDNPSNVTTLDGMMRYANYASDGMFGIMILVCVFFISFITMRQGMAGFSGQNSKVFVASAFLTTVIATMLFMIGVVNDTVLYVCIAGVAFGVFANIVSN